MIPGPAKLDAVTFTLARLVRRIRVLRLGGSGWVECPTDSGSASGTVSCPLADVDVGAGVLTVAAG